MVSLRTWEQQGVLHPIRTPGGHRRYLEDELHKFNVRVEETEDRPEKEPQEELVEDMIAIVTGFSASIYGKRGGKIAKKIVDLVESEVSGSENHS